MSKELETNNSDHFKRNSEYHRWSGAFLDPHLESDYIAHHNNTWVRSLYPTVALITLFGTISFGLVDWLVTPEIMNIALGTRFGIMVPITFVFLVFRNQPVSDKLFPFLPWFIIVGGSLHVLFLGILADNPIGMLWRMFPVVFVALAPMILGLFPRSTLFHGLAVLMIFIGVEIIWMPDDLRTSVFIAITLQIAFTVSSLGTFLFHKIRRNAYWQSMVIDRQIDELDVERAKSDSLLHNILPTHIAKELKVYGKAESKRFENVTILFTDFKGFTELVASIPADKLVAELNNIFSQFDDIMLELGVEKIQTIGDAYLAACGLPEIVDDHAQKCVLAAKKMIEYLEIRNAHNKIQWQMRVGIHSGPIVAGVVGKSKFTYGLFGDTINTASRFETTSEPGKINVSSSTYEAIKDTYPCEYRGRIQAKGKGELDMYFVR